MDISELFPNSPKNAFERIIHQDRHNSMDLKIVRDALDQEAFNRSPIQISTGELKASNGITYMTIIRRGKNYMEDGHSDIKGRADYNTARWKHVLLGHDEPDILKFDTDPKKICVECGESYTTHTNNKKCKCIPF